MKSKNIKIIDEHGIDRVANVICSIDVDGSDYVIYWIERDNDNDNLFISKIIKNNDGTSNMVNIDNSLEKGSLNDIVKELITHAINDDNDKLSSNAVMLKNGKNIKISSALFNKEQNINVQKTYITTVKKSVTKVSEEYYAVDVTPVAPVFDSKETEMFKTPAPEIKPAEVIPVAPIPEVSKVETPLTVEPVQNLNSSTFVMPEVVTPEPPTLEVPKEVLVSAPVAPQPVVQEVAPQVTPQVNVVPENPTPVIPVTPLDYPNNIEEKTVAVSPSVPSQPVNVAPEIVNPTVVNPMNNQPAAGTIPNNAAPLFFDGSNETNLVGAFNGSNTQPKVSVETISPIREFGQEEPINPSNVSVENIEDGKSTGFANNKFVMIIAVIFFLASCVFLGYEAFKYFQIK